MYTQVDLARELHLARHVALVDASHANRAHAVSRLQRRAEKLSHRAERVSRRAERAAAQARVALATVL